MPVPQVTVAALRTFHPRPNLFTPYEPPRDEREAQVCQVWQEILGVEPVGIRDDFFQLGGHSLLATQILSRVRAVFAVDFPLEHLFSFPTAADLAEAIGFLQAEAAEEGPAPISPSPLRARGGPYPLSFAQERLWFIDQLEPGNPIYNEPRAASILGRLDVAALEAGLREIGRRQEALRTTFLEVDGTAAQVVSSLVSLRLPVLDLSALADAARLAEAARLTAEEACRPFALARGPVLRTTLLRLGDLEHTALFTVHHIASDGWSLDLLVRELTALYTAFAQGLPSPLPELPVQYADFAHWQRQQLEGEALEQQLAYWREELAGAATVLELPADRTRPAVPTWRGGIERLTIPGLIDAVDELGRREGTSRFMTLLAAFQTLLHRLSGQADLLVGSPVANRTRPEIEGLIGFFVNLLVIRARFRDSLTFRSLLGQVRDTSLRAYAHQDCPFEKLVEAVGTERDLSRPPLFQVMFLLQNPPLAGVELPGLSLAARDVHPGVARFDLTLLALETDGELITGLEYSSDLFDGATARRWLRHLQTLLEAAVSDPDRRLEELPLLTAAERDQLLQGWNETAAEVPHLPVHRLLEHQVERTPDAAAVLCGRETLTYAELDRRAGELAAHLRALGVGPEFLVGLATDRSPDLLVAVLGTLKAGGAYVPLDLSHPRERLAMILEDARPRLLVTQAALLGSLPANDAEVVLLDRLPRTEPAPASYVSADGLAYVLFTSGSTGRPKGVQIPHRAFVNFLLSMREAPGLSERDTLLAVTTLSFDIAGLELLLPLLVGGRVAVATRDEAADAAALAERLVHSGATAMQATPATWRLLLDSGWTGKRDLKALCGGEALPGELASRLLPRVASVWNLYGPTETTVWSAAGRVEESDPSSPSLPLGAPVANTQLYLLDAELEPVPLGVPGELFIGGAGLARGYLGRPDLTAERFVPDPFAMACGARMYRTGDLVRRLPGGEIDFLGRVDQQVKVRGFRIELGEIEAALAAHPAVGQAAVCTRGRAAERFLVAYLVPAGAGEETAALRSFLRAKLPDYMVPSVFTWLAELPLTSTGKIDRRALSQLRLEAVASADAGFVAPRNPLEEQLAGIFARVLKVARLGVHDSFFDAGGHSLLASQVISRVRTEIGAELPLRRIFESPTIAGLAEAVQAQAGQTREERILPHPRRGNRAPLSYPQERLWFLERFQPGSSAFNIPIAVHLDGKLEPGALASALAAILQRHEVLRTRFVEVDGRPAQEVLPCCRPSLPQVDLAGQAAVSRALEAERIVRQVSRLPFDLSAAPLLRTVLLRLAANEHRLAVVLHHIVSDGWSLGVFQRDLAAFYRAAAGSGPAELAELPIQYADFAVWQRRRVEEGKLDGEVTYWRKQLAGVPSLELRGDRPRPPVQTHRGAHEEIRITPGTVRALSAVAGRAGSSLYMALHAGLEILLHRYAHQDDFAIGSFVANRNRAETEDLIGFFVNNLALRADVSGNPEFRELLRRVRETALRAYAHQDLPFEKLIAELRPDRDMSRPAIFQVVLNLLNFPRVREELPGLVLNGSGVRSEQTNFDLLLWAAEEEEGGLLLWLEHNADLFDAATARRMLGHLRRLLEAAGSDPELRVSELPMLDEAERRQVLATWSSNPGSYDWDACIHQLFERQAAATPDRVAVVAAAGDDRRMTYRELNERANRLARHLRHLGVGPEVRVGICMRKALEMPVAVLGVLKAGGCYVPLDATYARERLAGMLENAGVAALLTHEPAAGALPSMTAPVVRVDADWPAIAAESAANLDPAEVGTGPRNLVYVIFTSGSTGRPKGVMIEHRSLVNAYLAWEKDYRLRELSAHLQMASFSFDVFGGDFVRALCSGAKLVLCPRDLLLDPERLLDLMVGERIDAAEFVPAVVRSLVELLERTGRKLDFLRLLTAGSDAWYVGELLSLVRLCGPRTRVINAYGITETTIDTTWLEHRGDIEKDLPPLALVPIGRPFANNEVYLLDRSLEPVPVGAAGEMYIGGAGVGRGYLSQPGLTAARFVPHPFSAEPGARLYRSGDLARWLPSGDIEFLGRADNQVKIRGVRVEPGEIEAVLGKHPAVRQAVVVARDVEGDRRLVAYVVPETKPGLPLPRDGGEGWGEGERDQLRDQLRAFLRERLPEPMVPSAFVALDAFPLTPNGKVDRKALPPPVWAPEEHAVAPSTPIETRLAGIWQDLLGLDRVSAFDGFFDVGGHSLLATRLAYRVQADFRIDLPLRSIFEAPVLAEMALVIEELMLEAQEAAEAAEALDEDLLEALSRGNAG